MKKNKGFTLLEVLAVIIVLAVIALITIPIVTSTMKDAKKNSFKTSVTNLVKAADNYYADRQLAIDKVMTFCFGLTGSNCTTEKLNFSGKEPSAGKLIINPDGEISLVDITNGTYYANYNSSSDDEISVTEDNEVLTRDELTQAIKDLQAENKEIKQQLTSTTTIANTANNTANSLNTGMLNKTYPIGSIYISYSSTNPSSLFGGSWVAYGTGRTLVGMDTSQTEFNTIGKSSGSKTITLTAANLPSHNHKIPSLTGTANSAGAHTHSLNAADVLAYSIKKDGDILLSNTLTAGNVRGTLAGNSMTNYKRFSDSSGAHTHAITTTANTTTSTGSGAAINNLQPYITVYMWRRTA